MCFGDEFLQFLVVSGCFWGSHFETFWNSSLLARTLLCGQNAPKHEQSHAALVRKPISNVRKLRRGTEHALALEPKLVCQWFPCDAWCPWRSCRTFRNSWKTWLSIHVAVFSIFNGFRKTLGRARDLGNNNQVDCMCLHNILKIRDPEVLLAALFQLLELHLKLSEVVFDSFSTPFRFRIRLDFKTERPTTCCLKTWLGKLVRKPVQYFCGTCAVTQYEKRTCTNLFAEPVAGKSLTVDSFSKTQYYWTGLWWLSDLWVSKTKTEKWAVWNRMKVRTETWSITIQPHVPLILQRNHMWK